jgi:hypothetical protein
MYVWPFLPVCHFASWSASLRGDSDRRDGSLSSCAVCRGGNDSSSPDSGTSRSWGGKHLIGMRDEVFATVSAKTVGMLLWPAVLGLMSLAGPISVRAQSPPGPITAAPSQQIGPAPAPVPPRPAVQPRTSIFGGWKLNLDDSDDPRRKMQEARGSGNNGGGNRRMGGGYPGGGYPGGGGGGYGGHRMGSQGESDEDRQRMQEMLTPAQRLTLAEATKNVEVDAFDEQSRKRAFFTDGRKLQKSKDANYQEIAAHWDGARLVSDEKTPRGDKMSRTYELSYDGTQLYETLRVPVGRSGGLVSIRYVYDQSGGPTPAAAAPSATAPPTPAPPTKQ